MDSSITDLMKAASMMSKKYFGRVAGMWTTLTGLSIITT